MRKVLMKLCAAFMVFSLSACQSQIEEEEKIDNDLVEQEEVNMMNTYGKKTNSSIMLDVTNKTKQPIQQLSINGMSLLDKANIDNNEEVNLYVEEVADDLYTIEFTLENGKTYEIQNMNLNSHKTFSIIISQDKAYITVNGKKIVSKKEVEKNKEIVLEGNYVHVKEEDLIFTSFDQACSFALSHLDQMYKKYNKPVQYIVDEDENGKIILSWYVQDLKKEESKVDETKNVEDDNYIDVYTPEYYEPYIYETPQTNVETPSTLESTPTPTPTPTIPEEVPTATYHYVPEDVEVSSFEEGVAYGNNHLDTMYNKYHKPIQFYVNRDASGKIIVSWYVQD